MLRDDGAAERRKGAVVLDRARFEVGLLPLDVGDAGRRVARHVGLDDGGAHDLGRRGGFDLGCPCGGIEPRAMDVARQEAKRAQRHHGGRLPGGRLEEAH